MIIRIVERDDYDGVIQLIREFYTEAIKEYGSVIDIDFLTKIFFEMKDTSFLVEENGEIVGLLAGKIVTDLLSGESTYAEVMWFMTAEKRRYGTRLLKFVEDWAKNRGMRRMMMVHMCNDKKDQLADFYARIGYRPMEVHYIKELK
ncbi:MAG: GNAT family N-acetyltransferase [Candidatus Marinimicrobia bacterium]|nr:GNAT family N-acetyltransferase [Candidatus Neomarinimicrobiota bacterium]